MLALHPSCVHNVVVAIVVVAAVLADNGFASLG